MKSRRPEIRAVRATRLQNTQTGKAAIGDPAPTTDHFSPAEATSRRVANNRRSPHSVRQVKRIGLNQPTDALRLTSEPRQ